MRAFRPEFQRYKAQESPRASRSRSRWWLSIRVSETIKIRRRLQKFLERAGVRTLGGISNPGATAGPVWPRMASRDTEGTAKRTLYPQGLNGHSTCVRRALWPCRPRDPRNRYRSDLSWSACEIKEGRARGRGAARGKNLRSGIVGSLNRRDAASRRRSIRLELDIVIVPCLFRIKCFSLVQSARRIIEAERIESVQVDYSMSFDNNLNGKSSIVLNHLSLAFHRYPKYCKTDRIIDNSETTPSYVFLHFCAIEHYSSSVEQTMNANEEEKCIGL